MESNEIQQRAQHTDGQIDMGKIMTKRQKSANVMSGSPSEDFSLMLAKQVVHALRFEHDEPKQPLIDSVISTMIGIAPKDEIEGMFAAQMVAIHDATMSTLRKAKDTQAVAYCTAYLSQANKLTRSYAMLVDALNRYRGKGQQTITVQHLNVEGGGQAILGNITQNKGVEEKIEEPAHAQ